MRISGFSMVKNATKLYYPITEVITSILPLVDEFVLALGQGDADDQTREVVENLNSDKIRIIDTTWDTQTFPRGTENAHQTDIAKEACTGDWLFYLQADEVVHEQFLPEIEEQCKRHFDDPQVEGFLFNYIHFWGDYWHIIPNHGWYPQEIRIIRNDPDIHSWRSAQSFRRIPHFDGFSYRQKEGTYKLNVVPLDAYIYHYGWARPPHLMKRKKNALAQIHQKNGEESQSDSSTLKANTTEFDYGDLSKLPRFKGTHPKVMTDRLKEFDWADKLDPEKVDKTREPFKHETLKNRVLTYLEQNLMGGRQFFGHNNWKVLPR
jgi:hypothetical protein